MQDSTRQILSGSIMFEDPDSICLVESCTTLPPNKLRLETTLSMPSSDDLFDETSARIDEFNRLYNELNREIGGVTQKIPKEMSFLSCN